MKRLLIVLMLMFTSVLAAAGVQQQHTETHAGAMSMMMADCPMKLPGVDIAVLDVPAGVALTFTTKADNVAEMRRRVEHMAAMHSGEHAHEAMMPGHMMPANVKYEAVENGARLTLTPKDPASLAEFRTQVRTRVERMKAG
ncbi:MAG: hypothetical protein HYU27_06470, partial [Acidobacteria bacterium]|nr:hypothetical protein [Acidobacteriota bacterium]